MKHLFRIFISILVLFEISLIVITIFFDFKKTSEIEESFFLDQSAPDIDSLIKRMTLDEKIGQLFFLEISEAKSEYKEIIDTLNQLYSFGGIKFKNAEVLNQLIITNYLQARSKIPLFIGSEGDIINQSDFNLPLGPIVNAVNDSAFADHYFQNIAQILSLEGVNIDFTNTIDVLDSINTQNGFSDNISMVSEQSISFKIKLHNKKIISCLNYNDSLIFNPDSLAIDTLSKSKKGFYISKYFALQITPNVINKIANEQLPYYLNKYYEKYYGFKGLIFSQLSDSLDISQIKNIFESGTDVFIIKSGIEKNISLFKELVVKNKIPEEAINKRLKRILLAKKWAKAEPTSFRSAELSLSKIMSENRVLLSWKLYESSFCLVKNKSNILPIKDLLNNKTHLLVVGKDKLPIFEENLSYYMDFSSSQYIKGKLNTNQLSSAQNIIIALSDESSSYFKDSILIESLQLMNRTKKLIVINFGAIDNIRKLSFADVIIHAYGTHPFSQSTAAQSIAGAIPPKGKLIPAAITKGIEPPKYQRINRFKYTIPEVAGFDSYELMKIDSLVERAIYLGAMPGAQILAAKDGKVFYYKSFGYHTYSKKRRVKKLDIYDLASISKVAATTLAAMKLFEMDSIHPEDSIKYYIDDTLNCTIKNHQLADFFIHKTGLAADMPILQYISYRDSTTGRYDKYYSEKKDSLHRIKVADNYYFRTDCLDSIVDTLYRMEIDTTKPYLYSDINFNIIYDLLLKKIKGSYRKFVYSNFYLPLQLRSMGYLPGERFNKSRIAPTQDDRYWRKQLVHGTPHDESAAIYGGISGNAGLFSNANDLAILFQMLINGGNYGGRKVLESKTIEKFTSAQENSNRGLGFNRKKGGLFGHSGFTGCVVWANPQSNFVFVFLSNGIHPKATNKKLSKLQIRSKVYDLIWAAYRPNSNRLNMESRE